MEDSKVLIVSEDSVVSDLLTVLMKQNNYNNIMISKDIIDEFGAVRDGLYSTIFFDSRWMDKCDYEEICCRVREIAENPPLLIEITDKGGSKESSGVIDLPLDRDKLDAVIRMWEEEN
ncbi:MAG: hypothetical protein ACYTFY_12565 [Planctomycetota bacterium]|jgi:DNA-binding response OmpR family regulator